LTCVSKIRARFALDALELADNNAGIPNLFAITVDLPHSGKLRERLAPLSSVTICIRLRLAVLLYSDPWICEFAGRDQLISCFFRSVQVHTEAGLRI